MVTLKFPKINKALRKDLKDTPIYSAYRGVIILDSKAIVYRENYCLVVDLMDHFTIDCGINQEEDLKELEGIMMYMNGKVFSNEFWEELTKGAGMKMSNGNLFIQTPKYSKDLHYTFPEVDIKIIDALRELELARFRELNVVQSISLPFVALKEIYDTYPAFFKAEYILFEFCRQDVPVKFTFKGMKHFYGYIYPDYSSTQESFKFDNLDNFIDDHQEYIKELELESKPPAPPIPDAPTQLGFDENE